MQQILQKLHALQAEALEKGIHSFDITTRVSDSCGQNIWVSIFLTGDDSDGDYLSVTFYEFNTNHENLLTLVKGFSERISLCTTSHCTKTACFARISVARFAP